MKKKDTKITSNKTDGDSNNTNDKVRNEFKFLGLSNSVLSSSESLNIKSRKLFDTAKITGSALGESNSARLSLFDSSKITGSVFDESAAVRSSLFDAAKITGSALGESNSPRLSLFDSSKITGSVLGESAAVRSSLFDAAKITGSALGESNSAQLSLFDSSKITGSLLSSSEDVSRAFSKPLKLTESISDGLTSFQLSLTKLPSTYQIETQTITQENKKNERAIVKNVNNEDSIPVDSLASTLASTDIIKDLTGDEVFSFYNHLIKYPLLGLEHEVGKKILNEISKQTLIEVSGIKLFRARERNIEERDMPYNELEMFEAPYGIAGHGRFNVNGQGELYTCESKEVALKEINADTNKGKRYEVAEWELTQKVKLLDLSNRGSVLVKYCLYKKNSNNAQEYLLPNFLSQCAKYHQINGIKVSSTMNVSNFNYIFFDFEKRWFKLNKLRYDININ